MPFGIYLPNPVNPGGAETDRENERGGNKQESAVLMSSVFVCLFKSAEIQVLQWQVQ